MRKPRTREEHENEINDRIELTFTIRCCKKGSECQVFDELEQSEVTDTVDASWEFYRRGWRVTKLVNPPEFEKGTYLLAVCPNCVKELDVK